MKQLYEGIDAQRVKAVAAQKERRIMNTSPSKPLSNYAGTYEHSVWGDVKIVKEEGQLRMSESGGNAGWLKHWHYDTFQFVPDIGWQSPSYISFGLDNNGKIVELSLGPNYVFRKI